MFCPQCGQDQSSDEMRFCSRCGFQLGVVAALVASGGVPPAVIITDAQGPSRLSSKRRARQGAKLMFASGVLTPVAMGLSILFDSPLPFIVPFTIFLAGLAWMFYFRWFGDEELVTSKQTSPSQIVMAKQDYLTPARTPSFTYSKSQSPNTAEIVRPPSITEHTTKLLDVEEKNS